MGINRRRSRVYSQEQWAVPRPSKAPRLYEAPRTRWSRGRTPRSRPHWSRPARVPSKRGNRYIAAPAVEDDDWDCEDIEDEEVDEDDQEDEDEDEDGVYAEERLVPSQPTAPPPKRLRDEASPYVLEKSSPWNGSGKLAGPFTWTCRASGEERRYLAGRVAKDVSSRCTDDEPVLLYLAGLGDAGSKDPIEIRRRHAMMRSWGFESFLFLAPLRKKGFWWVIRGEELTTGWLGDFVPEEVEVLADLVNDVAGNRPVVGLGFSAGAYCLTELLATGRVKFQSVILGGLHGHGQPDFEGIAKRDQEGVKEKFTAYLERVSAHPGVPRGIFALHAEDDGWSPKKYAEEVLEKIGARNVEQGYLPVRYALIPGSKRRRLRGHDYEKAVWDSEILRPLLAGRRGPRLRGSVAEMLGSDGDNKKSSEVADDQFGVWRIDERCKPEATWSSFPEGHVEDWDPAGSGLEGADSDDGPLEESADDSDCESDEDSLPDDDDLGLSVCPAAEKGEPGSAVAEVVEDTESAEFDGGQAECPHWRDVSSLDLDDLSIQAEPITDQALPEWAKCAAELFEKNGFVIVLGALRRSKAKQVLSDCRAVAKQIVHRSKPKGNRHGGARYSFGKASSTGGMLHLDSFACHLLDNRRIQAVIEAIYAKSPPRQGQFKCVSAGGDFVLAGEGRFQRMHDDLGGLPKAANVQFPPPLVSANFVLQPIDGENGPMRAIPGTQLDAGEWSSMPVEPAAWRASRLFPLPVGAAIVRDVRTLHGGSPNLSTRVRFLPAVEFASEAFLKTPRGRHYISRGCLPEATFRRLRPATQRRICQDIVANGQVKATFRPR